MYALAPQGHTLEREVVENTKGSWSKRIIAIWKGTI